MTEETTLEAAANTTEGAATSTTADTTATAADTQGQAATEGQTTEATAAEGVKTEGDKGAPETYEFTAAEGREFDPAVIAEFSAVAKELNLPQEAAQKVLDKMGPAIAARQEAAIADARAKWVATTKADAEIGGPELAQNVALANTTFEKFGTPELKTLLETTGLGDHPELIRWAHRVGKAMSEDGIAPGRAGGQSANHTPQKLYPASNMNP
jgi:hypothetical protein